MCYFSSDVWMHDHYPKICIGPADSNLNVFCNQFGCYFRDLISPWKITLHLNFQMWDCSAECWRYDVLCCSMMLWCLVYWLTLSCVRSHAFSLQTIGIDSVLRFFSHPFWLIITEKCLSNSILNFIMTEWWVQRNNGDYFIWSIFSFVCPISIPFGSIRMNLFLSSIMISSAVKQLNSMMHCCC